MAESPRWRAQRATESLYSDFLALVQRSQAELAELNPADVQALCLGAVRDCGGGPVALLLSSPEGTGLRFELAAGTLPAPAEKLRLERPATDALGDALLSAWRTGLARLAASVRSGGEVVAELLVVDGQPLGALLVFDPPGGGWGEEERLALASLAKAVTTLLQLSGVFRTLMQHAMVDHLTGLFNQRYFQQRLSAEVSRSSRHGHALSLLFFDVDDYGTLADSGGRLAGQGLLQAVAGLLRANSRRSDVAFSFRQSDVAARTGAEEFVVLMPETPKWGALTKAERLRRAVEGLEVAETAKLPHGRPSISVGVASFPEDAADALALVHAADGALRRAKEAGKNRVEPA